MKTIFAVIFLCASAIAGAQSTGVISTQNSEVCILNWTADKGVIAQAEGSGVTTVLQFRSLPPAEAFRVQVSLTIPKGTYSLSMAPGSVLQQDCTYELEDVLTGATYDLRSATPYVFNVNRTVKDRFVVYTRQANGKMADK